jgi:hypothetical protein
MSQPCAEEGTWRKPLGAPDWEPAGQDFPAGILTLSERYRTRYGVNVLIVLAVTGRYLVVSFFGARSGNERSQRLTSTVLEGHC